jgi:hypothetical protein
MLACEGSDLCSGLVGHPRLAIPSSLSGICDEQIVRIRISTQPALVSAGLKDRWHAIMDPPNQLVGWHGDDHEGAFPTPLCFTPILPQPS